MRNWVSSTLIGSHSIVVTSFCQGVWCSSITRAECSVLRLSAESLTDWGEQLYMEADECSRRGKSAATSIASLLEESKYTEISLEIW